MTQAIKILILKLEDKSSCTKCLCKPSGQEDSALISMQMKFQQTLGERKKHGPTGQLKSALLAQEGGLQGYTGEIAGVT